MSSLTCGDRAGLALPCPHIQVWTSHPAPCIRHGMMLQNQILSTLRAPDSQARLDCIVAPDTLASRTLVAQRVCREFGFVDARGRAQLASCLKALKVLENSGRIALPAPRHHKRAPSPRCLDTALPAPVDVPDELGDVEGLSLVVVETLEQRLLWNTLLHREHPHGTATFAGCQVRYLIGSAHGWLGAVGFSASALHLRARDAWMAWSDEQRRAHLHRVVCLSRFLIRPGVRCRHLASHVLGRVLRRLGEDFEARYGYRPWLVETFVEPDRDGACFKAANFVCVGRTAGRGRQDRHKDCARTVKSVYMYELAAHWRQRLGVRFVDAAPSLAPGEGLDSDVWAANEFGGAPLGDKRLSARLVKSVGLLASFPGHAMTANPTPDRAAVKGYYRLVDRPDESQVTPGNILAPHRARTIARMRDQETVLCIQDGTDLNFATRPGCDGLGIIGRNQTSSKSLGLHLHLTLAVSGEGLPLGVLRCDFDAPPEREDDSEEARGDGTGAPGDGDDAITERGAGPGEDANHREKKTQRWLDGLHDVAAAASELSRKTRVVSVMDREADFFELFDEQRRLHRTEMLVRAKHDRCLGKGASKLFATMRNAEPCGHVEIEIDRVSERRKSSRKKARPARSKRLALAEVHYRQLVVPATIKGAEPAPVSVVHVRETAPPDGEEAVEWFLLTSLDVDSFEAAVSIIGYYLKRWRIEDFFRVLKSGCRAEHLAFHTAERLQRAITINAVIAWRLMLMTLLGREVPQCAAELMFTDIELRFLADYAANNHLPAPQHLGAAVLLVAILGGYQNRKHDPPPGHQIMWRGYERMSIATLGYRLAEKRREGAGIVQNE